MKKTTVLFAIFIGLIIISCKKDINNETLENKKWILTKIETDTAEIEPIKEIHIEFSDSTFSGFGGCNAYWGGYTIDGYKIQILNIYTTLMYCGNEITDLETQYHQILKSAEKIEIIGNELAIFCPNGELEYEYTK